MPIASGRACCAIVSVCRVFPPRRWAEKPIALQHPDPPGDTTQAGDAYRLWDAEQDRSLIPFAKPEIFETDLSQLALSLRLWGAKSTEGLALLDHPPKAVIFVAEAEFIGDVP